MILAALVLSFAVAKAEENTGTNTERPPVREAIKEKRDEVKENIKGDREAFREKMKTEREAFEKRLKAERETFLAELKTKREEWRTVSKEKVKEFWNRAKDMVGRRFEMAITNLEKVQSRVGEMITKLKAEGKDTAAATEALDLSKSKLASAKAKLAEIKALLPANTSDSITPETWEKIKLLAREAKDLLKEAKEALHDSIEAIKDLKDDGDDDED